MPQKKKNTTKDNTSKATAKNKDGESVLHGASSKPLKGGTSIKVRFGKHYSALTHAWQCL